MALDELDARMSPRDLIIQMGLQDHVTPLVTLIETNRDSSAICAMVVELAMCIAVRSYCQRAQRMSNMDYLVARWPVDSTWMGFDRGEGKKP